VPPANEFLYLKKFIALAGGGASGRVASIDGKIPADNAIAAAASAGGSS
jgi:hypothetical protein